MIMASPFAFVPQAALGAFALCSMIGELGAATLQHSEKEVLYLRRDHISTCARIDPSTGHRLEVIPLFEAVQMGNLSNPWMGRFYYAGRTGFSPRMMFCGLNPADGSTDSVVPIGIKGGTSFTVVDCHPVTGQFWGSIEHKLFKHDWSTNSWTLVGTITGTQFGGVSAIGISRDGTCYVHDYSNPIAFFYKLDLQTAHATLIASIPMSPGNFSDLAFDSQNRMWATYVDGGPKRGVYTIDLQAQTATKMFVDQLDLEILSGASLTFMNDSPARGYCSPAPDASGCVPSLAWSGFADAYSRKGYKLTATGVRNNLFGVLLYGTNGPASRPFLGGTLCLAPPYSIGPVVHSGGSSGAGIDCTGTFEVDFNSIMYQNGLTNLAGTLVQAQWIGREGSPSGSGTHTMSSAVEFSVF